MGPLLAPLDLRFSDPKVERSYHVYYAQVKRDLLPTAIMVMLLVNILQSLIAVSSFILAPPPPLSSAHQASAAFSSSDNRYGLWVIIPAALQCVVLIATCVFLVLLLSESRRSHHRRRSRQRLSSATQPAGASSQVPESGPSSSCSSETDSHQQQQDEADHDEEAPDEEERNHEVVALRQKQTAPASSDLEAAPKMFGQSMENRQRTAAAAGARAWSTRHLTLPYILWACQLLQLASGLWPLQSFISYSTLLVYSYTIYVIFPIRLMSCILLALGLSLSQAAIDYLLVCSSSSLQQPAGGAQTFMSSHFPKVSTTTNERTRKKFPVASYPSAGQAPLTLRFRFACLLAGNKHKCRLSRWKLSRLEDHAERQYLRRIRSFVSQH